MLERGTVKLEVVNRGNEAEQRRRRRKEIGAFSPPPPNLRSLGFQTPTFATRWLAMQKMWNAELDPDTWKWFSDPRVCIYRYLSVLYLKITPIKWPSDLNHKDNFFYQFDPQTFPAFCLCIGGHFIGIFRYR